MKLGACYVANTCCNEDNIIDTESLECLMNNYTELVLECEGDLQQFDPEIDIIDVLNNGDLLLDDSVVLVAKYVVKSTDKLIKYFNAFELLNRNYFI